MISLIEALNYRCLRYVRQPLGPFHVLVGPNATGKSTFLDVVQFLGRLTESGLRAAVEERTSNIQDLFWQRKGLQFELAIEVRIPKDKRQQLPDFYDILRYEVAIGVDSETSEIGIQQERAILVNSTVPPPSEVVAVSRDLDGAPSTIVSSLAMWSIVRPGVVRPVLIKGYREGDAFIPETPKTPSKEVIAFRLGPQKSDLGGLPEDESKFPVTTWFKRMLVDGMLSYQLEGPTLRRASPPGQSRSLTASAANLPWIVQTFRDANPQAFQDWVNHLRIALPDIQDVRTVLREDDRHRYLMIDYSGDLSVPSWSMSEGTLRLLALTLPAYLDDFRGILLVEEPENGLHPLAIETAYQSLSSIYDGQVLLATHSPLLVGLAKPAEVLCFSKDEQGATQIVSGDQHPRLSNWHGEVDLGTLFASGVLG